MSDQGERGVRWTEMNDGEPRDESREAADATATGPRMTFPDPEAVLPAPSPPAEAPVAGAEPGAAPHDVWGKVEDRPAARLGDDDDDWERSPADSWRTDAPPEEWKDAEWRPEPSEEWSQGPSEEPGAEDDVKVAPVREDEPPQWDDSLFDENSADQGGDDNYVPAVPTGAGLPAKPGKPSSGNWQMPDWMADEAAADAKLGGDGKPEKRRERRERRERPERPERDVFDEGGGRSRLILIGGVGLLVAALAAAGAVYFLKGGDDEPAKTTGGTAGRTASAQRSETPQVDMPPDKRLARFAGRPSRMLGRVADVRSGLSYPRLAAPWQVPTKQNKLGTTGWSGQQILVTERHGAQFWYGQLLTGTLPPSLLSSYHGPDTVKNITGLAAQAFEAQYYAFPHKSAPLASQAMVVDGRRGWLVASYLSYRRTGVRATGEIVATAVIDTGRKTPAVAFASMPNTHKKQYPDVNEFFGRLKLVS
ncbi:hypothetical protein [Actinomadura decatromicini]|uniref:Uncharacterized protein n=1 Tax=Actinomadura decatromicini TaxID=2604572 RepID=A0A5D3FYD6_9ACTN|nr:hypothetical protein [Actinomadura decatromicini]TYK53351.1 hypothetical protein FXF68_06485 [Actinomadura decatromicini]